MKARNFTFLVLALSLNAIGANATIHTVSNDINKPAQFSDIPAAITAATAGDTIYVNGTQYTYSDITINKKLIIIGAGFSVANQFNLFTGINNIYFYKDAGGNDGSGSVICGFRINTSVSLANGSLNSVNNIKLFRNQIGTIVNIAMTNWSIYNNAFLGNGYNGAISGGNNSSNVVIQNNIFYNAQANIYNFNQPSIVIDHNLFINITGSYYGGSYALQGIQFAIITNNIFTSSSATPVFSNVTQSTFNNNLSVSAVLSTYSPNNSFGANNNSANLANQVGVGPVTVIFMNVTDANNYNGNFNYRLPSSSTGHNAATDGSDIGIYGGSYPFPSGGAIGSGYDTSPLPPIPQINSVNIQNASVLPGQQLQVNVSANVNN